GYAYLKVRGYGSSFGNYTLAYINSTVPVTRSLQNVTVASGQSPCYDATQTITTAGSSTTFLVQNGGDATLIAGQNILLLPGTLAQSGSYMMATITTDGSYCFTMPAAMAPAKSVPLIPGMFSIKVDQEKPVESIEINNNK
ncbi:MAG: hypothetical protein MUC31_02405, partial [Bacteroidales bacterium]|nr:hypothetical protein [Bacteroidales bacterium]